MSHEDDLLSGGWDEGFPKARITTFSTTRDNIEAERESGFDSEEEEGEIDIKKEQEEDNSQFAVELVDINENVESIKQLVVVNSVLYIATDDNLIFVQDEEKYKQYKVETRGEETIYKIFVDPYYGTHIIISMTNGENYYANATLKTQPKNLAKLKGIVIQSVAWDKAGSTKDYTGSILLGTTESVIYEARLENAKETVKHIKMLYSFKEKVDVLLTTGPITGIEVEPYPRSSKSNLAMYLVIVITPFRLFQFIGGPTYEELFESYKKQISLVFRELPYTKKTSSSSELHLYRLGPKRPAEAFAWLSSVGIVHGSLTYENKEPGGNAIDEAEIIQYDSKSQGAVSLAVTDFHTVMLYPERLQILMQPVSLCNSTMDPERDKSTAELPQISLNTVKIAYEESVTSKGTPKGLTKDNSTGEVYLYTDSGIYKIVVADEERDVWRLYLEKALDPASSKPGLFEVAERLVSADSKKKDIVIIARADFLFKSGNFDEAANLYAKTTKSFEEVSLAFHSVGQKDALRKYLVNKLKLTAANATQENQDATQLSCLCTWLTELYLDKINQLRDEGEQSEQACQKMQKEFRKFLEVYKKHLHKDTTFRLISSHGQIDEVIYYATLIEDYERVISHWITEGNYEKALDILQNFCKDKKYEDHFYKFAPVLIQHNAKETVNMLTRKKFLDPAKLIPALMRFISTTKLKPNEENYVITYLEAVVQTNEDPAIHNLLLSLYAKQEDPTDLLNFLKTEGESNFYDPKYALRVCTENGQTEACVRLYSSMGLFEDAVELALSQQNIELAKECADKPEDDEFKKKLWLRIAKHVIDKESNVKKAIEFLKQTDKIKLEDILPFFPDIVMIDDFKEEICNSLEEYKSEIEELRREMGEATMNANYIREDIKDLKHRYGYITANAKCNASGCFQSILARDFYVFPCQHMFHADCLIEEVKMNVESSIAHKIEELVKKKKIAQEKHSHAAPPSNPENEGITSLLGQNQESEEMRELDELVSAECPFCGDIMINTIDIPFIEGDDYELESWKIGKVAVDED